MKTKWMKIILIASLAFNLAFVSTTIYKKFIASRSTPPKTQENLNLQENFKLQKEQKEKINRIIWKFKISLSDYKQDILDKRISIIEAMSDTDFNLEDIEKKTEELNKLENKLNLQFVDVLIRINAILEPEQRLNFLYELSQNWFFINKHKK